MGRARNTASAAAASRRPDPFSAVLGSERGAHNDTEPTPQARHFLEAFSVAAVPDDADERPDLVPAGGLVQTVHYLDLQNREEEDPDYNLFTYATLRTGHIVSQEHKNARRVTADAVADHLARGGL